MDYIADNALALTALLVSLAVAGLQIEQRWRNRQRTSVECRISTHAGPDASSGALRNFCVVTVTVRNIGRAIAVEHLGFEPAEGGVHASWSPAVIDVPVTGHMDAVDPMKYPSLFGTQCLVADGEGRSWPFTLHPSGDGVDPRKPFKTRAIACLSNGRTIKSPVVTYFPAMGSPDK